MPISEHTRLVRRPKYSGSSDGPRIIGVSPHGGIVDVYYEKTMPIEGDEPTEAMQMGNFLEGPLLDWAEQQIGEKIRRNCFRVADDGILAANHDALVMAKPQGIEAKYVGPQAVEEWGEPGTDQVPVYVAAQVQHQMHVSDLELVYIPVFMAKFRPTREMYVVKRDQTIIDAMVEAELRFWRENVIPRVPPDPTALPPLEILKRLKREPGSIIDLPPEALDVVAFWESLKAEASAKGKEAKVAEAAVLAELGEAEAGRLPDGRLVLYLQRNRKGYEVKATTYRQLDVKTPKEPKT